MLDELIIAEKPSSARKIAQAPAESRVNTRKYGRVPYFVIECKGNKIVVVGAAGHPFGVAEKKKAAFKHTPAFEAEWKSL